MRASRSETDRDCAGGEGAGRRSARTRRAAAIVAASLAWAALAGGGLFALTAHGAVAGLPADAPRELPAELAASLRPAGGATLVLVAHPACPCTRASIRELERVLGSVASARREPLGADVVVLFTGAQRAEVNADRVADDLRKLVGSMPGVRIVDDPRGVQASRLGARTSGTVLFYDDEGTLRFAGGITPGRGHEGDSAGADALRALLSRASRSANGSHPSTGAAVYGCGLTDGSPRP